MQDHSELVRKAAAGDRDALRALVERVWPNAFHLSLAIVRDRALAEDAAQEAAAELLKSIRNLRNPDAFRTWFYRLVTRSAQREVRRFRASGVRRTESEDLPAPGDVDTRVAFRSALASLSVQERTAIVLHYHYGFSSAEVGAIIGAPAGTVRYRLAGARQRLRKAIGMESTGGGSVG